MITFTVHPLSDDGLIVATGARNHDFIRCICVFRLNGTEWVQLGKAIDCEASGDK
jgi:hypothetical protein